MVKQVHYTKITPLPSNVPRLLALDLLHSHDEFIKLNPLVTGVQSIDAPRTAASDEYFSNWYEITEVITWGMGLRKKIAFKGVFHNQPWGLQSHIFAPMTIEFRNKYRVGGNQPGEPREQREMGVDTPADGLYLREDISFTYSIPGLAGYVKKEMQDASKVMIDRMTRKAELLDEGKLHAMFEDGKLKTMKPPGGGPSSNAGDSDRPLPSPSSPPGSPPPLNSPGWSTSDRMSDRDSKVPGGFTSYQNLAGRHESVRSSQYIPPYQQQGYNGPQYARPGAELPSQYGQYQGQSFVSELPADSLYPPHLKPGQQQQGFRSELPGDSSLNPNANQENKPQPPNATHPANRNSPQPSPGLGSFASSPNLSSNRNSSTGSAYQVTNPEGPDSYSNRHSSHDRGQPSSQYNQATYPGRPDQYRHSSQHSVEQWQRSVQNDAPIDDAYYRNSRHSHPGGQQQSIEPDHQRMSNLSIQQNADDRQSLPSRVSKCPVCGLFEGDEQAVQHHVNKTHFQ